MTRADLASAQLSDGSKLNEPLGKLQLAGLAPANRSSKGVRLTPNWSMAVETFTFFAQADAFWETHPYVRSDDKTQQQIRAPGTGVRELA